MRSRLAVVVLLAACGAQHPGAGRAGPAILAHVPADTPYVFAALEPTPRDYVEVQLKSVLPMIGKQIELFKKHPNLPMARFLGVLLEEMQPHMSYDGLAGLGLQPGGHVVFYGIGILPALRVELRDQATFLAFYERVIARSGVKLARNGNVWSVRFAEVPGAWTWIIAVAHNELLMTVAPEALVPRTLARLLGDESAGPSLRDTGELERLAAEYRFTPYLVGRIDTARAAAIFTDPRHPDRDVLAATHASLPVLEPPCASEIAGLVAAAPRVVVGIDDLSAVRTTGQAVLELAPDVVADLRELRAAVPGVGAPLGDAIFSFAVGIDLIKAVAVLRNRAARVSQHPYHCPELASLNELARQILQGIEAPLPSWAADLQGGAVTVKSVELGLGMPAIRAFGVLAASDTLHLLDFVRPQMDKLGVPALPADGTPVPLPIPQLPWLRAHAAMKGRVLGLSLDSPVDLARLIAAEPDPARPLASLAFDAAKLNKLMKTLSTLMNIPADSLPEGDSGTYSVKLEVADRGLVFRFLGER